MRIRQAVADPRLLGAAVVVAALGLAASAFADVIYFRCGVWQYTGCGSGGYPCCSGAGYPCQFGGSSTHKDGRVYKWNVCETGDPNDSCTVEAVLCQRDTYYTDDDCAEWCNEYSRYAQGCKHNVPIP